MAEMVAKATEDARFGCRVLIADDDGDTLASLRFVVQHLNHTASACPPKSLSAEAP